MRCKASNTRLGLQVESANSQLAEHAVSAVQKSAVSAVFPGFDVVARKLRLPGAGGGGLPTIDLPSGFEGAMRLGTEFASSEAVEALKDLVEVGKELSTCTRTDMVKCLGKKIIQQTPPFNFLDQMDDILDEVLEAGLALRVFHHVVDLSPPLRQGFVRVANGVAKQVLTSSSSLIQEAALSKFPAAGAPAAVHHSSLKPGHHDAQSEVPAQGVDPTKDGPRTFWLLSSQRRRQLSIQADHAATPRHAKRAKPFLCQRRRRQTPA